MILYLYDSMWILSIFRGWIVRLQRKRLISFYDLICLYQTYKFARHRILSCLCTCIYSPLYENNSSQFENIWQISEFKYKKRKKKLRQLDICGNEMWNSNIWTYQLFNLSRPFLLQHTFPSLILQQYSFIIGPLQSHLGFILSNLQKKVIFNDSRDKKCVWFIISILKRLHFVG